MHKGRRVIAPKAIPARPTTDFAKESLFNILNSHLEWETTKMLDLYAGIGSISLEALSRGCKSACCVEINSRGVNWLNSIFEEFGYSAVKVTKRDVIKWLKINQIRFDFVFADPPYDYDNYDLLIDLVLKTALKPSGIFVLEHRQSNSFAQHPNFVENRTYGEVGFTIMKIQ